MKKTQTWIIGSIIAFISIALFSSTPHVYATGFNCNNVTDVTHAECQALLDLYNESSGSNWSSQYGWYQAFVQNTPDTTMCDWRGITCSPPHIRDIQLDDIALNWLPSSMSVFTQLNGMRLDNNNFPTYPTAINSIPNLEGLVILGSPNVGIPTSITSLNQLSSVNFSGDGVTGIDSLMSIPTLASIQVDNNHLTSIPSSWPASNLYWFAVANNQLTSIPDWVATMTNLSTLDISHNQITALPADMSSLTNLSVVNFSYNQLTSIPDGITAAWPMVDLYLDHNQLTALPPDIGNLTNLDVLQADDNLLTDLPASIWNLSILTYLNLANNDLTSISSSIGNLSNLGELDLDHNQLSSVPDEMGDLSNLYNLSLSFNQLTSLPDNIGNLTNLDQLNIENNQFMTLGDWVRGLTNVSTLLFGNNPLVTLPPSSFGGLWNLNIVDVNQDCINVSSVTSDDAGLLDFFTPGWEAEQTACNDSALSAVNVISTGDPTTVLFGIDYSQDTGAAAFPGYIDITLGGDILPDVSNDDWTQTGSNIYEYTIPSTGFQSVASTVYFTGQLQLGNDTSYSVSIRSGYDSDPTNNTINGNLSCGGVTDMSTAECEALVDIYDENASSDRSTMDGWYQALVQGNPDTTMCDWQWVTCSGGGVVSLAITGNLLTTLPNTIGDLTNLTSLDLSYNFLSTVPDTIQNLSNLTELNLSNNYISSLDDSITNLESLETLDISHNQLTSLPDQIGELSSLVDLEAYNNQLNSLPDSVGDFWSINIFNVSFNDLPILPDNLANASTLTDLDVSDNQLTTLPSDIGALSDLISLEAQDNQISVLPDISGLSSLEILDLHQNMLAALPDSFRNNTTLTTLSLQNNQLVTFPTDLFDSLTSLTSLTVEDNCLDIPSISSDDQNSLTTLDAGWDGSQSICSNSSIGDVELMPDSGVQLNDQLFLFSIDYAQDTGGSLLTGFIDINIGTGMIPDSSNAGWTQTDSTTYEYPLASVGPMSSFGTIVFTGIIASGTTTNIDYPYAVTIRSGYDNNLADNEVDGTYSWVPDAFDCNAVTDIPTSECQALVDIYNANTGADRSTMSGWNEALVESTSDTTMCDWQGVTCTSSHVDTLTLSNILLTSIPTSISDLVDLSSLDISNNQISSLPDEIGNMGNLQHFDADNNLLTFFPEALGNATNLLSVSMANNQLTGISDNIGSLSMLETLNLAHNDITSLPDQIGNPPTIQTLILDDNQLTSLPSSIMLLTQLSTLIVSNNQLSALPDDIGSLTNLTDFEASHNALSAIPDSFRNLTLLTTLHLDNNALVTLPEGLFDSMSSLVPSDVTLGTNCLYIDGITGTNHTFLLSNSRASSQSICSDSALSGVSLLPSSGTQLDNSPFVFSIDYAQDSGGSLLTGSIDINVGTGMIADPSDTDWNKISTGIYEYTLDSVGDMSSTGTVVFTGIVATNVLDNTDYNYHVTIRSGYDSDTSNNEIDGTYNWSPSNFSCAGVTDIPQAECEALVDIYTANSWADRSAMVGWYQALVQGTSDNTMCDWHGVSCTSNTVTSLAMSGDIISSLPASITGLDNLSYLDIDHTLLTSLPNSIGTMNLSHLYLYNNALTSLPSSIGNLSNLNYLLLDNNDLTSLPTTIGNLHNLQQLSITANHLTLLPESIRNLNNLGGLFLDHNDLISLPEDFGSASFTGSLSSLTLDNNDLITLPQNLFGSGLGNGFSQGSLTIESNCLYKASLSANDTSGMNTWDTWRQSSQAICNDSTISHLSLSPSSGTQLFWSGFVFSIGYTQESGGSFLTGFVSINVGTGIIADGSDTLWTQVDTGLYKYTLPPVWLMSISSSILFTGIASPQAATGIHYGYSINIRTGYDNNTANNTTGWSYTWSNTEVITTGNNNTGGNDTGGNNSTPPTNPMVTQYAGGGGWAVSSPEQIPQQEDEQWAQTTPPSLPDTNNGNSSTSSTIGGTSNGNGWTSHGQPNNPSPTPTPLIWYIRAFNNGITTMPLASARLFAPIQRYEAATMIVNFVKNIEHKKITHNPLCDIAQYNDFGTFDASTITIGVIQNICDLGLMGWKEDKSGILAKFRPYDILTPDELQIIMRRYFPGFDAPVPQSRRIDLMNLLRGLSDQ